MEDTKNMVMVVGMEGREENLIHSINFTLCEQAFR